MFTDADEDGWVDPADDDEVLQVDHFYPFGLRMAGISTAPAVPNFYTFTGKEYQDELGLGWIDFGARMLDPATGRWNGVDALAEKYYPISTYDYVGGNPILRIDLDGRDWYVSEGGQVSWFDNDADGFEEEYQKWTNVGTEILQFDGQSLTYSWQETDDEGNRFVNNVSIAAVSGRPSDKKIGFAYTGESAPDGNPISQRIYTYTFDYSRERQADKGAGPLPETELVGQLYNIDPNSFQRLTLKDEFIGTLGSVGRLWGQAVGFFPGGSYSWGDGRYWISPNKVTVDGVERNSFSIHGGEEPGSAGCIDCMNNASKIQQAINRHSSGGTIPLYVKYPKDRVTINHQRN